MRTFRDTQDKEWTVAIDIGRIAEVRAKAHIDLYAIFETEARKLFTDPVLLVNVLYVLCADQCRAAQLSDEDFGRRFDGTVLENAANALLEAVVDFFPKSRQPVLRRTVERSYELAGAMQTEALKRIDALDVTALLKRTAPAA